MHTLAILVLLFLVLNVLTAASRKESSLNVLVSLALTGLIAALAVVVLAS